MTTMTLARSPKYSHGFSLIELAMVMMIIAVLLGGLFVAIGDSTNNVRRTNNSNLLKQVEEALYGYAQLNGRLPCPVDHLGAEFCGPDAILHGFISYTELGLPSSSNTEGLLLDIWQNPLRYSVHRDFTNRADLSNLFENWPNTIPNDLLEICNINDPCDGSRPGSVPAVVLSLGENWANFNAGDFSSTFESLNAGGQQLGEYWINSTGRFYAIPYNDANFDDQLVWLSPHILFNRLLRAGRLP